MDVEKVIVPLASLIFVALATWLNYQESHRKVESARRDDLRADYERVKIERDELLREVRELRAAVEQHAAALAEKDTLIVAYSRHNATLAQRVAELEAHTTEGGETDV